MRERARELSTRTDLYGNYTIKDVPPGRYTLTVADSPGVEPVPPATIEIKGSWRVRHPFRNGCEAAGTARTRAMIRNNPSA